MIKPTHTSGDIILRRNGEPGDVPKVLGWMDKNYYHGLREANYRDQPVDPRGRRRAGVGAAFRHGPRDTNTLKDMDGRAGRLPGLG